MPVPLSRRAVLSGSALILLTNGVRVTAAPAPSAFAERLAALEAKGGGRLGVAVFDSGGGQRLAWRADERFPMCSTFKFLAAAAILTRVDEGKDDLARVIPYGPADQLEYAPVTKTQVAEGGMSLSALCAAAVEMSDNTAGNLLLQNLGGPAGLTSWCRSLGDPATRLDRIEPFLNESLPGDERDTTTPAAMLGLMEKLFIGGALKPASREQLAHWMTAAKPGPKRLPAAIPAGARIGHKTGTGENGSTNDVAIVWPAERKPVLIAVYFTGSPAPLADREAVIADAGWAAFASL
jgi:beta-lactamase class A